MKNIEEEYKKRNIKIFGISGLIEEYNLNPDYTSDIFEMSEELTFNDILFIITKYESELINSFTKNEPLKDELLTQKNIVYRNKENKLSKDFYKEILQNIKNKNFTKEAVIITMEIISLVNLYGYEHFKKDKNSIKRLISSNIYSLVKYPEMFGDHVPDMTEKQRLSKIMLAWSNRFGNKILHNILNLELLKSRLEELLEITPILYKEELLSLIDLVEKAIIARDEPTTKYDAKTTNDINEMFDRYETINKELIFQETKDEDSTYELVHFVQTRTVNFQLIGNDVIDVNEQKESEDVEMKFNKKQNSRYINNYVERVIKLIEQGTKRKFSITDEEHRLALQQYLDYFNKMFNTRPLDRLHINAYEVGNGYKHYVRKTNKRLSTSFINKDNVISHLDRKVGLVISITEPSAIISTSAGYTSQTEYEVFSRNSASLTDLIYKSHEDGVNETCLDVSKCTVKYVLLIGDDPKNIKRAQELAKSYNVKIKQVEQNKILN